MSETISGFAKVLHQTWSFASLGTELRSTTALLPPRSTSRSHLRWSLTKTAWTSASFSFFLINYSHTRYCSTKRTAFYVWTFSSLVTLSASSYRSELSYITVTVCIRLEYRSWHLSPSSFGRRNSTFYTAIFQCLRAIMDSNKYYRVTISGKQVTDTAAIKFKFIFAVDNLL